MTGAPESLEIEVEKLLRVAGAEVTAKPDEAKRPAPMEAEQRPLAARDWTRSLDADLRLREMADIVRPGQDRCMWRGTDWLCFSRSTRPSAAVEQKDEGGEGKKKKKKKLPRRQPLCEGVRNSWTAELAPLAGSAHLLFTQPSNAARAILG